MFQFMSDGFVLLSILPFLPFIIVFFWGKIWLKSKKKAFKLAMDVTTIFLIASVGGLYNTLFNSNLRFYWILLLLLLVGGLIRGLQQQKYSKLNICILSRVVWRISFLILSLLYMLLLLIAFIAALCAI